MIFTAALEIPQKYLTS